MLSKKEDLFKNNIKDNNKLITNIKIKSLLEQKILIPNEQRIRDDDKVKEIIKYQEKFYKSGKGYFNFLGTINIHCCKQDNKNYLVDGQHRLKAMEILYKNYNYPDFNVKAELVTVNTREELIENYNILNKNTELPEFPENSDKNVVENVCKFFFNLYPDIWTLKKRSIRPHLNKNHFQEGVAYLNSLINITLGCNMDEEDLKKIILKKNEEMSLWTVDGYSKQIRKIKKWPQFLAICKKHNFYIGMYNYINEEYCFDWVKDIIKQLTGEELKKTKIIRKKKISKKNRQEVWTKYNGNNVKFKCFCCNDIELNGLGSWECGHIISEINGGNLNIENLRPICSGCNKSIATANMIEYMSKNYPNRLKNNEKQTNTKNSKSFFNWFNN